MYHIIISYHDVCSTCILSYIQTSTPRRRSSASATPSPAAPPATAANGRRRSSTVTPATAGNGRWRSSAATTPASPELDGYTDRYTDGYDGRWASGAEASLRHLSLSSPLQTVTSVTGLGLAGVGGEGGEAASFFPFPAILPPASATKTKKTAKRRDPATDAPATGGANAEGIRADAADPATPAGLLGV